MIRAPAARSDEIPAVTEARSAGGPAREHRQRVRSARRRRPIGAAAAVLVAVAALLPAAPVAAAGSAIERAEDYARVLTFDVESVDPVLVTAGGPDRLTVTGTLTNAGPEPVTELIYRFQRGGALSNEADVRQRLAEPSEPNDVAADDFTPLFPAVAPGESVPFTASVSLTDPTGLDLREPGVYPIMINVNGLVQLDTGPLEARIGELYFLLTVLAVPAGTSPDGTSAPTPPGTAPAPPVAVNVLWPLVDRPHLGVGGVFLDDGLATAIAPGGRLSRLVDALSAVPSQAPTIGADPAGGITIAIDPGLLDELDRMSRGYRVVADPAAPQPAPIIAPPAEQAAATDGAAPSDPAAPPVAGTTSATAAGAGEAIDLEPDAAVDPVPEAGTVPGTGGPAAAAFLDRLRALARSYPVLVLPRGDADATALIRAGLPAVLTRAIDDGRDIAQRVLAPVPLPDNLLDDVALPLAGAVDAATLAAYTRDGFAAAVVAAQSVQFAGAAESATGAARLAVDPAAAGGPAAQEGSVPAAIADADPLTSVGSLVSGGNPGTAGWALRVNAITAVLAQRSLDGSGVPSVVVPDRRWDPNATTLAGLTRLLTELTARGVVRPAGIAALAAAATDPADTAYPDAARAAELTPQYLGRLRAARDDVAELRSTLTAVPQAVDPMPVVESLAAAVDAAAAGAFRTDPAVGNANLATVESTVAAVEGGVAIASAGNSYRLASSSSPLVLTVQNTLPFDVALSVRITGGERVGLSTTDPGPQLIEAGSSQQIRIPTEVSRSGQFQVGAQLVTSTGATWGSPVVLAVESTAYGAFTVIMMIVAGGVLVLMVALRIVQRLRARRARLAAQATADQPGQTVPDEPAPIQPPPDEPTAREPTAQVDPTPHPAAGEQPAGPSPGPQPARNATDRPPVVRPATRDRPGAGATR